ncbi:hypothetical protein [Kribbella sp. NPDC023855]|uniref:hypothetical protein n=1 Tax=Kribbella sp. NPDC023855 TaxID=3154698 RepID=UPI00340AEB7E
MTIYDPAVGVTPDQLRDKLRRSGVTGVLDKGQQPPTKQPGQKQEQVLECLSYGTAREWCDHRWSYGAYRDPQVYFLDHTSAAWPVTAAVNDWYQAVGIDAYYRWHTAGCPSGTHCVHVYNGGYGRASTRFPAPEHVADSRGGAYGCRPGLAGACRCSLASPGA